MYFVYVIYSESRDLFNKGITEDPADRLARHNRGESHFTSFGIPWKYVLLIPKPNRKEAYALERKLKNLSRERLKMFIAKYSTDDLL
ncbi:MAG: GIY-YIG nuclease family protein [Bacteroidetes bacterium]|nr:GIY-YIG nuclease family protein [Bacteroidota bacterium]